MPEQRERLSALGVGTSQVVTPTPAEAARAAADTAKGPGKAGSKAEQAFQRGLAALAHWVEREGQQPV
ncbi:hypothetical protein ACWDZ8_26610 [Streptomyces sp. NPDC003233]